MKLTKNKRALCSKRNQNDFPMTKKYRNEMKKNVNALEFLGAATLLGRTGINVAS